LASARVAKFSWRAGETFEAEIWILNESPTVVAGGRVEVSLEVAGASTALASFDFPELSERKNFRGPTARGALPTAEVETFTLEVRVSGRPELDSSYTFSYRAHRDRSPPAQRALNS
jgi:beta-mannosidase